MNKTEKTSLMSAGFAAIFINTLILKLAKPLGIIAESGGLLKLILTWLPQSISNIKFMHTQAFWYFFHLLTGAVMVIGYALFFDNIKTSVFRKGLFFSLFPWIINGVVILPLLHQGILGTGTLPLSGIIYYFFANAIFGLSLAYLYSGLKKNHE